MLKKLVGAVAFVLPAAAFAAEPAPGYRSVSGAAADPLHNRPASRRKPIGAKFVMGLPDIVGGVAVR